MTKRTKKTRIRIAVKRGMIFRLKRRRIRITSVNRAQHSVEWEHVSRTGKRRYGKVTHNGWTHRLNHTVIVNGRKKIIGGRTFLHFDGIAWTMPPAYVAC